MVRPVSQTPSPEQQVSAATDAPANLNGRKISKTPTFSTGLKAAAVAGLMLFDPTSAQTSVQTTLIENPCAKIHVPRGCILLDSSPYASSDPTFNGTIFCQVKKACKVDDNSGQIVTTFPSNETFTCEMEKVAVIRQQASTTLVFSVLTGMTGFLVRHFLGGIRRDIEPTQV